MPAAHLEVVERFKEPAISNYANQITGEYRQKDITKLADLTMHNAKSDTAILGYFEPNSVMSYEQIAYENGLTYFDAGVNGWDAMFKANEHLAPAVNKEYLYKQISEGKEFVLSSNPYKANEIYETTRKGKSYLDELLLLSNKGYKFEKYGDLWKAVKNNGKISTY